MKNILTNIFILIFLTTSAQKNIDLQQVNTKFPIDFYHLKLPGGIEQNSVTCFAQDSTGMMWLGTKDGLVRYDTKKMYVYTHKTDVKNSLSNNFITHILVSKKRQIYIGTQKGIQVYQPETDDFHSFLTDLSGKNIMKILEDKQQNIWILPYEPSEIYSYNPLTNKTKVFSYKPDNHTDNLHFIDFISYDKNIFYISTNQNFILKFNAAKNTFKRIDIFTGKQLNAFPHLKNYLSRMLKDDKNRIWITTNFGYSFVYNPKNQKFKKYIYRKKFPLPRRHYYAIDIFEDKEHSIWIGTWFDGLYKILPDRKSFVHLMPDKENPHSLSNNIITSVFQDNAGYLWFSSEFSGVNILKKNKKFDIISYDKKNPNSLPPFPVLSVASDTLNRIFVGTDSGGLVYFDKNDLQIHKINSSLFDNALRFFYILRDDKNGHLWLGTERGLFDFNPYNNRSKKYTYEKDNYNSLSSWNIFSIAKDHKGNIWAGTFSRGINKLNTTTDKNIRFLHDDENPNSLSYNYVGDIQCDKQGNIWIATLDGLNRFDPKTGNFKVYKNQPTDSLSIGYNKISCIYPYQNKLWIGTNGGGLIAYDYKTKNFRTIDNKKVIPDDNIRGITSDNHGNLWISTTYNLVKLDPKNLHSVIYNASDGLEKEEYIRDYGLQKFEFLDHVAYKDDQGYLYFGGTTGLFMFHPDSLPQNNFKPPVLIEQLKVNGKKRKFDNYRIQLQPDENHLEIDLSILNYIQSDKNRFAYLLEPYDSVWQYGKSKAEYFNLPYGKYTFYYNGANNDGVWNTQTKPLTIFIKPHFYQTGLFKLIILGILLLIGLLFLLYRQYLKKQMQRKKELLRYHNSNLSDKDIDEINRKMIAVLSEKKLYIEADLSLQKLAKIIDTLPNYLSQVINVKHDKNFREYINTYRIEFAKKMLINTRLKIEAVAFDSGFNTISTFNIAFKKETGITPSQFRKKYGS